MRAAQRRRAERFRNETDLELGSGSCFSGSWVRQGAPSIGAPVSPHPGTPGSNETGRDGGKAISWLVRESVL